MKKREALPTGAKGLTLVEEAVHTARKAPLRILVLYYIGAAPFVLALIYFWADMAQSAFAYRRVVVGSFGLALLFAWMKTWQCLYARRLHAYVRGEDDEPLGPAQICRMALTQTTLHTTGILTLPLALLFVAPFGWVYAFYQNITVLDRGDARPLREQMREASVMAGLWKTQNHLVIWLLSPVLVIFVAFTVLLMLPIMQLASLDWSETLAGIYALFFIVMLLPLSPMGVIVAANVATAILMVPMLMRTLLGIETVFTLSGTDMINPTFFVILCGMTYLLMDPLLKAAYVLRCYHGAAIRNGADLLDALAKHRKAALIGFFALLALTAAPASAQEEAPAPSFETPASVSAPALDQAIEEILERPAYAWRLPRVPVEEEGGGRINRFMTSFFDFVATGIKDVWNWLKKVFEWFFPSGREERPSGGLLSNLNAPLRFTIFALMTALAIILLRLVWKSYRHRITGPLVMPDVITKAPDIEDEDTLADELPEEGWLQMAEQLLGRGETRLAMRAHFLASLARLARANLIRIARYKSNREYARELERIAHVDPELPGRFGKGIGMFEAVWYGIHEISEDSLRDFADNQAALRESGASAPAVAP